MLFIVSSIVSFSNHRKCLERDQGLSVKGIFSLLFSRKE